MTENKIDNPLDYSEPSSGKPYADLLKPGHPLADACKCKITPSWLAGFSLAGWAHRVIKKAEPVGLVTGDSAGVVAGFQAFKPLKVIWHIIQSQPFGPAIADRTICHTLRDITYDSIERNGIEWYPGLDIIINNADPCRKSKQTLVVNATYGIPMLAVGGLLIARWTDPRDWDTQTINFMNWFSQFGPLEILLSPFPGRPVYLILTKMISIGPGHDFPERANAALTKVHPGPITLDVKKDMASKHAHDVGNASEWSEQYLSIFE